MWLVDTNIVSELARPKPDRNVIAFFENTDDDALDLSAITLGEIRYGIARMDDAAKREARMQWLDNIVRPMFSGRIIPVGEAEVLQWRLFVEQGKRERLTFSQPDLFIAATAAVHGLTLVTRNVADFIKTGIRVFNPFTGERFNGA